MKNTMRKQVVLCMIAMLCIGLLAMTAMAQELPDAPNVEQVETVPQMQNYSPVLRVELTADKTVCEAGETITWTVTVRNVSFFTAHDVVVTDELTNDVWVIGALYPGAALSFHTTTEQVPAGEVWNTVIASWDDGDEILNEAETEEAKSAAAQVSVTVKAPAAPSAPAEPPAPYDPSQYNGEIEIFDEDVPLADVPLTGDFSAVWLALSVLSAGGAYLLDGRRRKEA